MLDLKDSLHSHFFNSNPPTAPGAPHSIADITAVCVSQRPNIFRFCTLSAAALRPFSSAYAHCISLLIHLISTPFLFPASSRIPCSFDLLPEARRFPTSLVGLPSL